MIWIKYRPYVCKLCGAAFMRSNTLKIHSRKHEKEKQVVETAKESDKNIEGNKSFMNNYDSNANCGNYMEAKPPNNNAEVGMREENPKQVHIPLGIISSGPQLLEEEKAPKQSATNTHRASPISAFLPLSSIRGVDESKTPKNPYVMPSTNVSFSSTASPFIGGGFMSGTGRSPQNMLPQFSPFGFSPYMMPVQSPLSLSPNIGAGPDFGSVYSRAMYAMNGMGMENSCVQSPTYQLSFDSRTPTNMQGFCHQSFNPH